MFQKGGEAADKGLSKGGKAVEKGVEKGGKSASKGIDKAGDWLDNKFTQGEKKLKEAGK